MNAFEKCHFSGFECEDIPVRPVTNNGPYRLGHPRQRISASMSIFPTHNSNSLPVLQTPGSIPRISPETLIDVINGKYDGMFKSLHIIDCRYAYEYAGGHIIGATQVSNPSAFIELFFETPRSNALVVLYCEFSQDRGPQMAMCFRNIDRDVNRNRYPELDYPHVYVLDGGYRMFYQGYENYCDGGYVPMLDTVHRLNGDLSRATSAYRHSLKVFNAQPVLGSVVVDNCY